MPTGGNIAVLSYGRSSGGVLFDPSLPVEDVRAVIHSGVLLYGHSFGLFGRSASAAIALPYAWGEMNGLLAGDYQRITRSGLADLRGQLTVNLLGGPALAPREFAKHRPSTILGLSLAVAAPTGQYDPAKLINIGANRWSFKPELGFSRTKQRWYLELYGGVWFFGANGDYYGGSVREQDPIGTFQAHVSYTFKPRLWLAADATFYTGGRTKLNGIAKADLQQNSRLGAALAVPVGQRSVLKVSWASGFTTRIGADFDLLGVAFQTVWFGRP
jgi:Putative MetA-pathway of phenol degradation